MTDEDILRKEIEDYDELCNKCMHKNLCEITRIYTGIFEISRKIERR